LAQGKKKVITLGWALRAEPYVKNGFKSLIRTTCEKWIPILDQNLLWKWIQILDQTHM
jgi:hypothetical protein